MALPTDGKVATLPDTPRNLRATPGAQQVQIMWEAPTSNGRAPILYYEYRVGTSDWTIVRGARSADIADLTNGQINSSKSGR